MGQAWPLPSLALVISLTWFPKPCLPHWALQLPGTHFQSLTIQSTKTLLWTTFKVILNLPGHTSPLQLTVLLSAGQAWPLPFLFLVTCLVCVLEPCLPHGALQVPGTNSQSLTLQSTEIWIRALTELHRNGVVPEIQGK